MPSDWWRRSGPGGSRSRRSSRLPSRGPSGLPTDLNALAVDCFDARTGRGGRAARRVLRRRSRRSSRTTPTSPACPTMQGTDAFAPSPAQARRRLRSDVPGHRSGPAGQDPALRVRLQRLGRAPAARPRPVARGRPTHTAGASSAGSGGTRGGRCRPARPCQRRRRLDPHPGSGQRAGRAQADPRPAVSGPHPAPDAGPGRGRRRRDPVGPRHRRIPPRGGEGVSRPEAGAGRRRHPRIAGATDDRGPDGQHRHSGDPRGRVADPGDGRAAGVARPPRRVDRPAGPHLLQGRLPSVLGRRSRRPSSRPAASSTVARGTRPGWTS